MNIKFAIHNTAITGLVVLASLFFSCCSKEQPRATIRPLPTSIELDSVIEQGETAQRRNPADADVLRKLGEACVEKILAEWHQTLSLGVHRPQTYNQITHFQELTEKALQVLQKAIQVNPKDSKALVTLAQVYIIQRHFYYDQRSLSYYLTFRDLGWRSSFGKSIYSRAQRLKHLEKAYDMLQKALMIDRGMPDALLGLGYIFTEWGENDSAIIVLKAALQKDPGNAAAWYQLSQNYIAVRDVPNQMASGKRAFKAESNDPVLLFTLSAPDLYYPGRESELPFLYRYNKSTKLVPLPLKAPFLLGLKALMKKEPTSEDRIQYVISPLERAIALKPDFLPAYYRLLGEYAVLNDYEKAMRALAQMTKLGKLGKHYTPEALYYASYSSNEEIAKFVSHGVEQLGDSVLIYFRRGNFQKVLELEPNNLDAYNHLVERWIWAEVPVNMKATFYKMLEIAEGGAPYNLDWVYDRYWDYCSRLKDTQHVIELFRRTWRCKEMFQPKLLIMTYEALASINRNAAIELFRSSMVKDSVLNSLLYMRIGLAYYEGKEYEKAVPAYEKSIALNWENYESHETLGEIYEVQRDHKKAIDAYDKARDLDGRREQRMLAHVAEVYDKLGERLKSDSLLTLILEQNPKYAFAHYVRGKVLLARGLNELALNSLRIAADLGSREAEEATRNVRAGGVR